MSDPSSPTSLRSNPTILGWDTEIRRILSGEREHAILHLGSGDEYVHTLLAQSLDPPLARSTFQAALENVIESWQPEVGDKPGGTRRLLELIAAFAPHHGFVRIMSRFDEGGFNKAVGRDGSPSLDLLALSALESYYPVPPAVPREDEAFQAYVGLLWRFVERSDGAPYALLRLVVLNQLPLGLEEADRYLSTRPGTVATIVEWLFDHRRQARLAQLLPTLFGACLSSGSLIEEFTTAVRAQGATIHFGDTEAHVEAPHREGRLELVEAIFEDRYVTYRLFLRGVAGEHKFKTMTA